MVWQDIVIMVANLLFVVSLLNQIIYGFKYKSCNITLLTSGLTIMGLFSMAIAFFTLGLYLSTFAGVISVILWLFIFIQRVIYRDIKSVR